MKEWELHSQWVNDLPESIETIKQPSNLCGSVSLGGSPPVPPLVLGFGQIDPAQQQRRCGVDLVQHRGRAVGFDQGNEIGGAAVDETLNGEAKPRNRTVVVVHCALEARPSGGCYLDSGSCRTDAAVVVG